MRLPVLLVCAMLLCTAAHAQLLGVYHEVYFQDDGNVPNYPEGHTTYRIYAQLGSETDALVGVMGLMNHPGLYLGSSNDEIWNSAYGGVSGAQLNDAFFPLFPEMEYDSMITLNRDRSSAPGGAVVALCLLPSNDAFDLALGADAGTASGLMVEDGIWFSAPDQVNVYPATEENTVLLAQVTCAGDVAYRLTIQVLEGGIGGESHLYFWDDPGDNTPSGSTYVFDPSLGLAYPQAACCDPEACNFDPAPIYPECDNTLCEYSSCAGCTDPASCHYDPGAMLDDGSCADPCAGCTNPGACNFDPLADFDDASCLFGCYGCTDDQACNFDPDASLDDGSCLDQCPGCLDTTATNYAPNATYDDGTCQYVEDFGITIEPHTYHTGPTPDGVDLTGYTTYRVFVHGTSSEQQVSSIGAWAAYGANMTFETSTAFWQSPLGGPTVESLHAAFFDAAPSYTYDSFLTLGKESSSESGELWVTYPEETYAAFENNGGAIDSPVAEVSAPLNAPHIFLGEDHKVLIAQLTTDGSVSCCVVARFLTADGSLDEHLELCATNSGCTDQAAVNYTLNAYLDDGSCTYWNDEDALPHDPTVGMDALDETSVRIYPNPASDVFWVEAPQLAGWNVVLLDGMGRVVDEMGTLSTQPMRISCADHVTGMYTLAFSNALGQAQYRRIQLH